MPIKKEREYRALAAPLTAQSATKLIQTEYYVEGYATTFDTPYLLYEFEDGTKIYERIDAHALDGADMSDVIMQYPLQTLICSWAFYGKNCRDTQQ